MNLSQVEDAIESKQPFLIRTADGREFQVPTRDHIAVSPKGSFVVVFGDDERITSIPLLMIASVSYQPASIPGGA